MEVGVGIRSCDCRDMAWMRKTGLDEVERERREKRKKDNEGKGEAQVHA